MAAVFGGERSPAFSVRQETEAHASSGAEQVCLGG